MRRAEPSLSRRLPGALPCLRSPSLTFPSPGVDCPVPPALAFLLHLQPIVLLFPLVFEPRAPCGFTSWRARFPSNSNSSLPTDLERALALAFLSALPSPLLDRGLQRVLALWRPTRRWEGKMSRGLGHALSPLPPSCSALAPSTPYTEPPLFVGIQGQNKTLTGPLRSSWLAWRSRWE